MSGQSSLLVEKLWRLKRRIDKGQCPGVDFIHLNVLLREPAYRADVLRRVETNGSPELQALAREIMANDPGEPLMAKSPTETLAKTSADKAQRRSWLLPSMNDTPSPLTHAESGPTNFLWKRPDGSDDALSAGPTALQSS